MDYGKDKDITCSKEEFDIAIRFARMWGILEAVKDIRSLDTFNDKTFLLDWAKELSVSEADKCNNMQNEISDFFKVKLENHLNGEWDERR